jgi:hypothetical protein
MNLFGVIHEADLCRENIVHVESIHGREALGAMHDRDELRGRVIIVHQLGQNYPSSRNW